MSELINVLEACLLTRDKPLTPERLQGVFEEDAKPTIRDIKMALVDLQLRYEGHATELKEVASGWRFQVRQDYAHYIGKLFAEKPPRYGRAFLETLAIIAYRQPITRGEIEEIRGVAVSSNIMRSFIDREWIRAVGHKEVPGRPAMFATTKLFLDHFGLKSLDDLPALQELKELADVNVNLKLPQPDGHDEKDKTPEHEKDQEKDQEQAATSLEPAEKVLAAAVDDYEFDREFAQEPCDAIDALPTTNEDT